jgi:hypothetical protein
VKPVYTDIAAICNALNQNNLNKFMVPQVIYDIVAQYKGGVDGK